MDYIKAEEAKPIKVGPWGGPGGSNWTTDLNDVVGINMITIRYAGAIDSLVIRTVNRNGDLNWSARFGGPGGDKTDKVSFEYPGEILTSIEGRYGSWCNGSPVVVTALTFITNRATYGPYGKGNGTSFHVPVTDGKIVGFHGRAGQCIDSIGVCLKHIESDDSVQRCKIPDIIISTNADCNAATENSPVGCSILRWPSLYGGVGGKPWDDGVFQGIKGIVVHRDEDVVYSISIEYDKNGKSVLSPKHGGSGGKIQNKIKFLNYPDEYLVSVHGFYGPTGGSSGFEVIKSLTVYTNEAKYGPLGDEIGRFFASNGGGKVVGLLGRSGCFLDALGMHMEYLSV